MKKLLFIILTAIASTSFAQTWTNPMSISGELVPGGIGDPYMMKYKGVYYLYASNDDAAILRCWTSKDLINWSDAIICSTDPTIKGAYAPEVVYWNGMFYMYTSPHGNGHYVLSSNSPTGPFTVVTSNLGKVIDGSVFIDDDGQLYFYHADGAGIFGCPMPTPTSIGTSVNLNAQMNGQWTEGPCVFKRNDIYYLLYTGNHVLSQGYRIDYATNIINPISRYTPQVAQNPILVKSEGDFSGVGHGTAFIGPDLDTYYFTYHNLVKTVGGQPLRKYNFDRIAWNGDKLSILGPTNWAQQAPQLAVTDYFDRTVVGEDWLFPTGGNWGINNSELLFQDEQDAVSETGHKAIFTSASATDYTAEFTIREVSRKNDTATLGAIFSYSDEENYGVALFNSSANQLEINFLINNVWKVPQSVSLPAGFNYAVWHGIRIEKSGTSYRFFVDGMQKAALTSNLGGGKVGYITRNSKGDFSYVALSKQVKGSGILDTYKPVPGTIAAVHYNTGGEGVGYHDLTPGNADKQYIRNDSVDINTNPEGGFHISSNQSGEWYNYNVNVEATGVYNVGIRYAASAPAQIKIQQGTSEVTSVVELPATGSLSAWRTFTLKGLHLTAGYQTLKVETITGDFNFYEMQFKPADNEAVTVTDDFTTAFSSDWNFADGNWNIESGQANIDGYGKKVMGSAGWTDYTIEADIRYISGMNAGVIFRVNNPAAGGENNNPVLGTDFLQGYFVGLGATNVSLGKHNYGWASLTSAPGTYSTNTTYHIKIVVSGANIKVYVTDMTTPKIDYTDTNPFISGKVGFRSHGTHAHFDNFSVTTAGTETGIEEVSVDEIDLFLTKVHDILTINTNLKLRAKIYNTAGQLVIEQNIDSHHNQINVAKLAKGIYIVKLLKTGIFKQSDKKMIFCSAFAKIIKN
ncbi:MAG: Non-reducing end alpha-L-arabinofuranosidase BoGH43A [Candidatus Ordinivivax streblomastigis]|uniref:Non-reducing end alpha-L-arabinofuranosidase BoGH43A n=1 Tax=Candidatus Ordinivivax streblomastigis TaxID=2540710 RepID=A0A5M8P3T7_9BACT|nr:MAG: Non-reducing end alpha-L-arabinofuranosidase BoGH43A [Candidatus Ordinivivax streblomastigis]